MKRTVASAAIIFSDGSYVGWKVVGKNKEFNKTMYAVHVLVKSEQESIDIFFETWDKPSMHTASHFIRNAIKDAKAAAKSADE